MAAVKTNPSTGASSMSKHTTNFAQVTVVGLDLAKRVFQIHAIDAQGKVVVARSLRRADMLTFFQGLPSCLIGMEACASSHYWGRELTGLGHTVRLMPPAYVKPYVRRQKNDAADAAALAEAVTRPSMRFVAVRTLDNQVVLMRHKVRGQLVAQRTALINALRSHLGEAGVIAAQGVSKARELAARLTDDGETEIPPAVRHALLPLARQIDALGLAIADLDREIRQAQAEDDRARRLASIPGIGPLTATLLAASVPDTTPFATARDFSAYLGLVPKQSSSGGKPKLGGISKMGNRDLRRLLVVGAMAVLRHRNRQEEPLRQWIVRLLAVKPIKLVAVALANKLARIAWAILTKGDSYRRATPSCVGGGAVAT
jgi:transposase